MINEKNYAMIYKYIMLAVLVFLIAFVLPTNSNSQSGQLWSASDWQKLLNYVDQLDTKTLYSEYKAGEGGHSRVKIKFKITKNNIVLLVMDGPGEYIIGTDPSTGLETSRNGRAIFFIIDIDKDGIPDEFSDRTSPYRDRKKYFKVEGDDLEEYIYLLWNIGVSYTINKHLYNIERVFRD